MQGEAIPPPVKNPSHKKKAKNTSVGGRGGPSMACVPPYIDTKHLLLEQVQRYEEKILDKATKDNE